MPLKSANPPITGQSKMPPLHDDAPLSGGLNAKHSPRWIPDNQAAFLRSVSLADVTSPARRTGYAEVQITSTGIDAGLLSKRIGGLSFMNPSEGTRSIVINIPNDGAGGTFYADSVVSGGWGKAYKSDGSTSWDPGTENATGFMANERLWMVGGPATPIAVFDNTALLTEAGVATTDAPFGSVDGTYLLNRVFLLAGNKVYWSNVLPETPVGTFQQVTSVLTLSPNKGSKGVAIKPWKNTSLIVFFDDSIEELIISAADPSSSTRNVIEPNYGCGSRDSVVVVGEDMYFMDQYGHMRSLKRTSQGIIQGVVAAPLSDIIRKVLPARLNKSHISRVKAHLSEDKLDVYFPIDLTTESSARVRWDFSQNIWTGPDVLAHAIGGIVSSNIRSQGTDVYFSDASTAAPDAAVYRFDDATWGDNGAAATFKMETKGFTAGFAEVVKGWIYFELEYHGDVGATPTVGYRLDEIGSYTTLTVSNGDTSLLAGAGSDWPIVTADWPILTADWPLVFVTPAVARARYLLEADAVSKSRSIQFQIQEATAGTRFRIVAWRIAAQPKFINKAGSYGD